VSLEKRVLSRYIPKHIAIIMDGNGRWAKKRGLDRTIGHKMGTENLKNIAIECKKLGVKALSVYAFSTENWKRPKAEIDYLMGLPKYFEEAFKGKFEENEIRVMFSGRRDRFPEDVKELIKRVEEKTKDRKGMILNICFDYGSYTEMLDAVKEISKEYKKGEIKLDDITEELMKSHLYTKELPNLDLMIRTSGELRISNFLLWQIAYSELYFPKVHWPAFNRKQLLKAIDNFQKRNRRFGGLKEDKK
jgi:undecaprenyl diphosphate synthase